MRDLLRSRDFRLLLGAQALSMAGDWCLLLVFGIWTKTLTGSNSLAGLMVFAMAAPTLLAPFAAVLVDRLPRRTIIAVVCALSVPIMSSLWFVHSTGQLWLLASVAVWQGFSGVILNAAVAGLVQHLVPVNRLAAANGALATARQGLRLIAPLIGAGLFSTLGGASVATLDAATFAACAALVLCIRSKEHPAPIAQDAFRVQVIAGVRHLLEAPVLRRYTAVSIFTLGSFGLIDAVIFAYVDGLGAPVTFISVLVSVQGAAAILAGLAVTTLGARIRPVTLGAAACTLATAGIGLTLVPAIPVGFVAFALLGAALPTLNVATTTLLQQQTPKPLIGRTSVAFEATTSAPYTGTIALGALLVGLLPYTVVLATSALGCLTAAVLAIATAARERADTANTLEVTAKMT